MEINIECTNNTSDLINNIIDEIFQLRDVKRLMKLLNRMLIDMERLVIYK